MQKIFILCLLTIIVHSQSYSQKGNASIVAGPLISFPLGKFGHESYYKTGLGVEVTGQYNISERSSLILQSGFNSFGVKNTYLSIAENLTLLTLKGGYKYELHNSGFFLNGLVGTDIDVSDGFTTISFTLGAGKRFPVKKVYFIDAGLDFIDGDTERRLNFKLAYSIWQRPKP